MFVLNAQRRVVLFNQGCEQISGWQAADVLGKRVEMSSPEDATAVGFLLSTLAPPAEVWQGQACQWELDWPQRSGESSRQLIQFWPIPLPDGPGIQVVLGIVGTPTVLSGQPLPGPAAQQWHQALTALRLELRRRYGERSLIGATPEMRRVLQQVQLARQSTSPVFISGDTGAGKDHVARSIHYGNQTESRAFVQIDGRLTPPEEQKQVLRRLASEIPAAGADPQLLPGSLHFAHLDAAEADVHERLRALLEPPALVRLIVSSEQPLARLVETGRLSRELAWLLSPVMITLPPLRERGDDIALLAQHFLELCNRNHERQVTGIDEAVLQQWRRYRWPGNLDELQKVVQEAHAVCDDGILQTAHLPFRFRAGVETFLRGPQRRQTRPLDALLERVEREEILQAIAEAVGNLTLAAELLQIPRPRLYRRMELLGLRTSAAQENPESSVSGSAAAGVSGVSGTPESDQRGDAG